MLQTKQLQYFVVSADCGSFREAAKILYTTQSNVSKVIAGLESQVGYPLFLRDRKGIVVTSRGKMFYQQARSLLEQLQNLEDESEEHSLEVVRISTNPSSWFANQFVDFYNETFEKNYHFQLTTAGVRSVMERVRDYMDDIGFVYILSHQQENFLHELAKNKMEFVPMYQTDVIFYPGRQTEFYDSGKERVQLEELEGSRFIQNYQDEFFDIGSVQENAFQWKDLDISVLTNSDYIMEKMLKNSKVSNVSGSYLSENKTGTTPGIPLELGDNKVIFGYIIHKGEKTDDSVEEFLTFLKGRLPKS